MRVINKLICFFGLIAVFCCVEGTDFDTPRQDCDAALEPNISFAELEALYLDETLQIQDDLVIEGYVISSDKAGNFYNVLFIQDKQVNPTSGAQLEIELRESHLVFPIGSMVLVKLKGLYLGKSNENLKLGGTFTAFGNISVGRLPSHKIDEHIFLPCDNIDNVEPTLVTISGLDGVGINTLVRLEGMEIVEEELGNTFALEGEDTERTLLDCEENEMGLLTSGYSDFQAEILPEGNGAITGILQKDGNNHQIVIRDLNDLNFIDERCPEIITEFTSTQIFISELADPDNNSGARFVELYNAAQEPLDLNNWSLRRYTNDNTEIGSSIDLSGFIVQPQSTFIISPNTPEFELVYGFPPDMGVSTNSPADSNGDDNLELVDPFGTLIDAFGIVGEDGSGTNHEFEDGRAVRKGEILQANPVYNFEEWIIYNDTGGSGTTKLPQNAPEDFTPGERQ
ncbi:DUF5689 domain-containing protein [Flagellimonas sp. 2504JD4-2]